MRQVAGGASKFGLDCARCLRRKPPCRNDVWYLNEVVVTIARQKALVVARRRPGWICAGRNRAKPPQHQGRQALADAAVEEAGARAEAHDHRLARSYGAAKRQVMPDVKHRSHKGLNNGAENSHVPPRKRERMMQRSDRREACNASSRPCQPSATSSSRPKRSALAIHVHRLSAMALVISRPVCTARPTPQVPTL